MPVHGVVHSEACIPWGNPYTRNPFKKGVIMMSLRLALRSSVLCALLFAGCQQPASVVYNSPPPPPAPYAEVIPPPPYVGAVWIRGYWRWHGGGYIWIHGYYPPAPAVIVTPAQPPPRVEVAPPPPYPAAVWVPGHWRRGYYNWVWVPGHYRTY